MAFLLHLSQEQQTLSIAKAGIICSLNARTSVLAAANPRMSQWDERLTVVENIQLPHTLLSRFDLIFLMLDPQDEQFDRRLATHLVSLYHQSKADEENVYMVGDTQPRRVSEKVSNPHFTLPSFLPPRTWPL